MISGKRAGEIILNNPNLPAQKLAGFFTFSNFFFKIDLFLFSFLDNHLMFSLAEILLKTATGSSKCHDNVTVVVVQL